MNISVFLMLHLLSGFLGGLWIITRPNANEAIDEVVEENPSPYNDMFRKKSVILAGTTLLGFVILALVIRNIIRR